MLPSLLKRMENQALEDESITNRGLEKTGITRKTSTKYFQDMPRIVFKPSRLSSSPEKLFRYPYISIFNIVSSNTRPSDQNSSPLFIIYSPNPVLQRLCSYSIFLQFAYQNICSNECAFFPDEIDFF